MDWRLLGIGPTKDKKAITAAYRARVAVTNPEDQPEAFMALRAAYEEALRLASEPEAEGPVEQWMERVRQLYGDFPRRQDPKAWEALLSEGVRESSDTAKAAEQALLEFLMEHYYLPRPVWAVLEDTFRFSKRREALYEFLPKGFVDQVLLGWETQDMGLPPELFRPGLDAEACDRYTRMYFETLQMPLEKLGENLDRLEAMPEWHPYGQSLRCGWLKERGDREAAFALWQELAQAYPDNPKLVLPWAHACLEAGDTEQAEALARHLLDVSEDKQGAKELLADALAASGRIREGKEILYELHHSSGADPVVARLIMEKLNQWNEQYIGELEARLKENPADGESLLELCWCLIQNQRLPEAEAMAEKLDPDSVKPFDYHNMMGKLFAHLKKYGQAMRHLMQAEEILRSLSPDGTEETDKLIRRLPELLQVQGAMLMEQGRTEEAREKLEAGLALAPEDPELLSYMGRVFNACGDHLSCIRVMEEAARVSPGNWSAHFVRAMSLFRLGRDGEAFQAVNTAIGIYSWDLSLHIFKMQILLRNGAWDAVREGLKYLKESGAPEDASVLWVKAQLMELEEEKLPEALKQYRQIEKRVEDGEPFLWHAQLYYRLARLAGELENPEPEALMAMLDKGLSADPEDEDCLDYKAWLLKREGKAQEAVDMYRKLQDKPYHLPFVEEGLAKQYYGELEQWADKALECYEALLRERQTPELYFYGANCRRHMGDLSGAREYYLRELELDPEDVDGWNGLSHVCCAQGDYPAALKHLEKALEAMERGENFFGWLVEQKAMVLRRLERFEEAAQAVESAIGRYDWPDGWRLLFDIHCQAARWDLAQETVKKWKRARLADVEASIAESQLYLLQNKMFPAVLSAGMVKRRMSRQQETDFRVRLGEMEGNYRRLAGIWSRRARTDPDWDLAYLNLSLSYRFLGDKEGSRLAARKALALLDKALDGYSVHRPLILTRRAMVLGLLDRMDEASRDLEAVRTMPLCENCPYGGCKDADIYEATLAEIAGEKEKALELYLRGRDRWHDDLDFISGIRRLQRKGRGKC